MRKLIASTIVLAGILAGPAALAGTQVMIQPKNAVILSSGPGFGSIVNTYNQAGLNTTYVDGVTPTQPYLSTATHTNIFACCEWFGEAGTTTATVSYFATPTGKAGNISSFELWNEESSGIGVFDLWLGSFAGDLGTLLLRGAVPTDNPLGPDYLADVWSIAPNKGGWFTIVASGCPQPNPGSFPACAIGEVAFNGDVVPEPATWALMIAGFVMVGTAIRRREAFVTA